MPEGRRGAEPQRGGEGHGQPGEVELLSPHLRLGHCMSLATGPKESRVSGVAAHAFELNTPETEARHSDFGASLVT